MYAILRAGGRQYRVRAGQQIDLDQFPAEPGQTIELTDVLAIGSDDGQFTVGTPTVPGAVIKAQVIRHYKGKKIIVFKYKPKVRYRRKLGHRQLYTRVRIEEIVHG